MGRMKTSNDAGCLLQSEINVIMRRGNDFSMAEGLVDAADRKFFGVDNERAKKMYGRANAILEDLIKEVTASGDDCILYKSIRLKERVDTTIADMAAFERDLIAEARG